jgi:predicted nucleotidyltransferase
MEKMKAQPLEKYKNQITYILKNDEHVLFAYLFGSSITGIITPMSDIDIAVYLIQNTDKTKDRFNLIGKLIETLRTDDIDLVILNTAPLTLTARIIRNKEILVDKSSLVRHSFESLILRQYYDFSLKENHLLERRFSFAR